MAKRKAKSEPHYKWSHPIEWLDHFIDSYAERPVEDVLKLAKDLASKLDGDTIQDLFQQEMDDDGYFTLESETR